MYKNLLIIFVLLHVLGDFYFQTDTISEKKISNYKYVVFHSIIYAAVFCVGTILIWSLQIAITILVLSVLHFMIDSIKYLCIKYYNNVSETIVYCTDQCVHILSIIITVMIFKYCNYNIANLPEANGFLSMFINNGMAVLKWACIILIVCKPANITIKKMLSKYKPSSKDGNDDNLRSQVEAAKAEIGKPFPQEAELAQKSDRLAELNALLNIDSRAPAQRQASEVLERNERPSVLESLKTPCVGGTGKKLKHELAR